MENHHDSPPGPPKEITKISDYIWEIPQTYKQGMNVPARIIASKKILSEMDAGVFDQVTNVACLPGIVKHALCMPDGHWGYGFPIGGVAAFDLEEGVISPGGIGFDINCGMRLLTTNLTLKDVKPRLKELVDTLFKMVPAGVGGKGFVKVTNTEFNDVMTEGMQWCIENGYGWEEDRKRAEEYGRISWADHTKVSQRARQRGINQLGTLGSGNHYLEIQRVGEIFDQTKAAAFGITNPEQIVVMVHCGSRGFGHQIATDYLHVFDETMRKYGIHVKDRQLSCAPFQSKEAQDYFAAMACGANMAFANRQVIMHQIRESFKKVFKQDPEKLEMNLVYDVAHNIAKVEEHTVDGKKKKLIVHRKGSTRSFGPGHSELIPQYKDVGQPVIVGGSMETGSHLLVGTQEGMEQTWGSTCHGSGRTMSRTRAKNEFRGERLQQDMEKRGIYVKAVSMSGLAEEAGAAYKDIDEVIESVHQARISRKVVSLKPIGNVKG